MGLLHFAAFNMTDVRHSLSKLLLLLLIKITLKFLFYLLISFCFSFAHISILSIELCRLKIWENITYHLEFFLLLFLQLYSLNFKKCRFIWYIYFSILIFCYDFSLNPRQWSMAKFPKHPSFLVKKIRKSQSFRLTLVRI